MTHGQTSRHVLPRKRAQLVQQPARASQLKSNSAVSMHEVERSTNLMHGHCTVAVELTGAPERLKRPAAVW